MGATAVVMLVVPVAVTTADASVTPAASVKAATRHAVHADLDGDGKPDIVIGTLSGNRVEVRYTTATVHGSHTQWITSPQANTFDFGAATAVGDFNGDGFEDLAVGAPDFEDSLDGTQQGAVFVYAGSRTGLHYTGTMFTGPDTVGDDNEFGTSVAAGDVNGDGFSDLAVGNPGPAGGGDAEGDVVVFFGSKTGLTQTGKSVVASAAPVAQGDFGQSVVLADVNNDGRADLIVGEPGGGPVISGTDANSGDVQQFLAGKRGLTTTPKTFDGSTLKAAGNLGSSLAAGDVNHDGYADIVSGAPQATVGGQGLAGKVLVLFGGKHGLASGSATVFSKATAHVAGTAVSTDRFGFSVAIGDLNADKRGDVIVGVPGGTGGGQAAAGQVYIFRGTKSGVTARKSQVITQAIKGVGGKVVAGSELGYSVSTLGLASAAHRELLIGMPFMHQGGRVYVLSGGSKGVTGAGARAIMDNRESDEFGAALPQ